MIVLQTTPDCDENDQDSDNSMFVVIISAVLCGGTSYAVGGRAVASYSDCVWPPFIDWTRHQ